MGRDPKIGRKDFKNGSRQGDSNPSKTLFAKSEFLKAADFFPFIKGGESSSQFQWFTIAIIEL